jgi:hypothetical protein
MCGRREVRNQNLDFRFPAAKRATDVTAESVVGDVMFNSQVRLDEQ